MADSLDLGTATCVIGGDEFIPVGIEEPIISPWTTQPLGAVVDAGASAVDRAVEVATIAASRWVDVEPSRRARLLDDVATILEERGDELASLVSVEMGMPITLARATQSSLPASVLRATATLVRTFAWAGPEDGATILRRGAGVVGAITPWNMPVHQIIAKLSGAIAAGCSVVLKPSEQTPYDAALLAKIFLEAGAPDGLFNVVTGIGAGAGAALAAHPGLARMSFTGSVSAGRSVAIAAAANLTPCTLELGGKSPSVVLPDVDLDITVARLLESGLVNSGQACNATTRLVIPRSLQQEIEDRIAALAPTFTLGDPADIHTRLGPLVSRRQRQRVLAYVQEAVAGGARVVTGSAQPAADPPQGWFVEPMVLADLHPSAPAVQEEIFGPVLVLQPYDSEEEAIALANGTRYGLSAEVWSADTDHAFEVGRRIRAGQIKINGVRTRTRPTVPFGGIGDSGYGRELGLHGVLDFCDITAVMS